MKNRLLPMYSPGNVKGHSNNEEKTFSTSTRKLNSNLKIVTYNAKSTLLFLLMQFQQVQFVFEKHASFQSCGVSLHLF